MQIIEASILVRLQNTLQTPHKQNSFNSLLIVIYTWENVINYFLIGFFFQFLFLISFFSVFILPGAHNVLHEQIPEWAHSAHSCRNYFWSRRKTKGNQVADQWRFVLYWRKPASEVYGKYECIEKQRSLEEFRIEIKYKLSCLSE